jgi:hypothetical protein
MLASGQTGGREEFTNLDTDKPIDPERERGIRERAQLLTGVGIPNADALARELQASAESCVAARESPPAARLAEGEGPVS